MVGKVSYVGGKKAIITKRSSKKKTQNFSRTFPTFDSWTREDPRRTQLSCGPQHCSWQWAPAKGKGLALFLHTTETTIPPPRHGFPTPLYCQQERGLNFAPSAVGQGAQNWHQRVAAHWVHLSLVARHCHGSLSRPLAQRKE